MTRTLVRDLAFSQLHVFPFSARPGTRAFGMRPRVPERVSRERAAELGEVSHALAAEYRTRWNGREVDALLERGASGRWLGVSGNYLKVWVDGVPGGEGKGSLIRAVLGEGGGRYLGPA
jgi:threonylcarbamoyladenosine tRNA methylthiotransferase MtaB